MDKNMNTALFMLDSLKISRTETHSKAIVTWLPFSEDVIDLDLLYRLVEYLKKLHFLVPVDVDNLKEKLDDSIILENIDKYNLSTQLPNGESFYASNFGNDKIGFTIVRFVNAQKAESNFYTFSGQSSSFQISLVPDEQKRFGHKLLLERGSEIDGLYPVSSSLKDFDVPLEDFGLIAAGILAITPGVARYVVYDKLGAVISFNEVSKGDNIILLDTLGQVAGLGGAQFDAENEEYLTLYSEPILINGDLRKLKLGN